MKVYTKKDKSGHRVLHYSYNVNSYMGFCFHLMEEVGQPWQKEAEYLRAELCQETNSIVKTIELDCSPWYVDVLVSKGEGVTE